MKKLAILIVILLIVFSLIPVANSGTEETEIYSMLKQQGFDKIFVSTENNVILIKLGTDVIPKNAAQILLNVALESFKLYDKADGVVTELYSGDNPEFALFLNGKDASDYFKGMLTDEEISELAVPVDIRSDFSELSDDLLENGFFAESVYMENGTLNIVSEYFGKSDNFNSAFLGALFDAVQDCPYAKNISLKIRDGKKLNVATVQSGDVLSLMNDEISPSEFEKRVRISKENPNGKFSFGAFPINGKNTNGIIAVILFLISLIFFALSHKKKSGIAKILKAKRVNLGGIPENKRRIYGKFNGIVYLENPLTAPFSEKETVIYKGRVFKKDKNGSKVVWEKEFASDFLIKDMRNGEKHLLVKKENLPEIELSVLTKRKLTNEEIDTLRKEENADSISGNNLFVIEKGLENGRKVFFIGGMERNENGEFVFVKRPNYPNFIALHSERKLTAHTVRASNVLKFIGILSLLSAVYFAVTYFI